MHNFRQTWLLVALGLACGAKNDETTAATGSDTGADTSTSSASDPATTETPTTTGTSTGGDSSSSSSGDDETTMAPPACETAADDCGVTVSESGSACADPPPAKDELILEAPGPGQIKFTERGRISACNVSIGSEALLGPNRYLIINYVITGTPDPGCLCPQDVTATISGLTSGQWTVSVGAYEGKVDVP